MPNKRMTLNFEYKKKMQATVEISLNPLSENYEQIVVEFIMRLKKYNGLRIDVNGLSTQIFGDYDRIMDILKTEMKRVFENEKALFHLKLCSGLQLPEKVAPSLRT